MIRAATFISASAKATRFARLTWEKAQKAKEMARQLEARRRHQEAQREAILLEEAQVAGAERGLLELQTLINELVHAAFKSAGYHKHRGEYRRKRNGRDSHSRSDS